MEPVLLRALSAAAGGICGFLFGLWRHSFRHGKYLRKAVLEIGGGAVAGTVLALPVEPPAQAAASFLVAAAWSLACQWARGRLTRCIERASDRLFAWLQSGETPAAMPGPIRTLATRRPAVLWFKLLHAAGLSNLADEQVAAYETYRTQVAWEMRFILAYRWDWLLTWVKGRAWVLVLIAAVGLAVLIVALVRDRRYGPAVQALFILLLFLGIPDPRVDPQRADDAEAIRHFYRCWCSMWASWFVLYVVWSSPLLAAPLDETLHSVWVVARNFVVNANTLFVVLCFLVLHDPPYITARHTPSAQEKLVRAFVVGAVAVAAFTAVEMLCRHHSWVPGLDPFGWITGFAGGVALALLVGRLESKYINPPVWLIIPLYFYAVMQGAMGAFESIGQTSATSLQFLEPFLLAFAFALKCLLFVCVAWVLEGGLLLSYMTDVRGLESWQERIEDRLDIKKSSRAEGSDHA
jgi:hypothetical protein